MKTKRKPNVKRTGERLCRLAYDLGDIAARLREAGFDSEAGGVLELSSRAGKIGRTLNEKLGV